MTPLFTFGICVAITIALLLLFMIVFGGSSMLLVIIFPAILTEQITGERGLDFGRKSLVYLFSISFFVLLEILLIASIFFGLYCLFFGYPIALASTGNHQITANDVSRMLFINKTLLAFVCYFIIRFLYFSIKQTGRLKQFDRFNFFLYRILPIISLPIAFIYLWSSHTYLLKYPSTEKINLTITILSYIYVIYLLYSFAKSIIGYVRLFSHGISNMSYNFWFTNAIGLIYDCLFIYFFYQLNVIFNQ